MTNFSSLPWEWPPKSNVVNFILPIESSSDAVDQNKSFHITKFWTKRGENILGWRVGTCWAILSSLSMCKRVVFPALSSPRKSNFPDFFQRPVKDIRNCITIFMKKIKLRLIVPNIPRTPVNQSQTNIVDLEIDCEKVNSMAPVNLDSTQCYGYWYAKQKKLMTKERK